MTVTQDSVSTARIEAMCNDAMDYFALCLNDRTPVNLDVRTGQPCSSSVYERAFTNHIKRHGYPLAVHRDDNDVVYLLAIKEGDIS